MQRLTKTTRHGGGADIKPLSISLCWGGRQVSPDHKASTGTGVGLGQPFPHGARACAEQPDPVGSRDGQEEPSAQGGLRTDMRRETKCTK